MRAFRFIKTGFILFIYSYCVTSLKPSKLPSGKDRIYKYNRNNPELDIKLITPMDASLISKHWLNNILQPKQICEEDALIVEKINALEQFIQDQFTHQNEIEIKIEYLAWMPQGITKDILFLVILETYENRNKLLMLINSPFWESKQINTMCLLESLKCFSSTQNKTLDIESFIDNNIRYKLSWKDFKIDIF